jgi:hypothetical protein
VIERDRDDFIIVTPQENLNKLFTLIYGESHVIYIQPFKSQSLIEKLLFLPRWFLYRKSTLARLAFINGSTIYFFFVAFGLNESWLIKKLSRSNKIIYNPIIDISNWKKIMNVKIFLKKLYIYLIYRIIVSPKQLGNSAYWTVSETFLKQTKAEITDLKVDKKLVSKAIKSKLDRPEGNKILYITGGVVEENYVDQEEFTAKSDSLITNLGESNILLKIHPRYKGLYSKENSILQIPGFIPINLMLDQFRIVIGYSSAVLFEAANNGSLSISLLDYYKELDSIKKKAHKDYLSQNLNRQSVIHYPKTITEIKDIINLNS